MKQATTAKRNIYGNSNATYHNSGLRLKISGPIISLLPIVMLGLGVYLPLEQLTL